MSTVRIQMHLYGDSDVLERDVVNERLVYIVHVVILRLKQERRRGLLGDMDIRISTQTFYRNMGVLANYTNALG